MDPKLGKHICHQARTSKEHDPAVRTDKWRAHKAHDDKNMDELLSCKKKADGYARILSAGNFTDWQSLHEILYQFILCKYSLYGICHDIYSLDTLAQMSVAKTIQMTGKDAFKADSKASCEGTTSAMNKKILLLMALQRRRGIFFPEGGPGK